MTIRLERISKSFQEHVVIADVSIEVQEKELFVLLGSSGCGKSTVLRLIAGLIQPDSGEIFLNNLNVTQLPPQARDTGFVFQNYAIFKHMTVGDNVEFGLKVRNIAPEERRQRRDEMLELVGLSGFASRMPLQLSGGQRQRVALARALAFQPTVLLLDEPFGALDVKIRAQLRVMLRNIQDELGVTTILVTHDQEEAFELGDRIGILDRGQLVEVGAPHDLYHRPKSESAATFLGAGNVIVGRCEGGKIRIGSHLIDPPPDSPLHEEGAPVRVLFRPESVRISEHQFEDGEMALSLGECALIERNFAGALNRLRFEVRSLQGSRPVKPPLQYGQRFPVIDVFTKSSADAELKVGRILHLGTNNLHVLDPSGIRMLVYCDKQDPHNFSAQIADVLMLSTHGPATLLGVVPEGASRESEEARLKSIAASLRSKERHQVDFRTRIGQPTRELVLEVQQHFYDFVIFGGEVFSQPGIPDLEPVIRRLLVYSRMAVLIGGRAPEAFRKILICTAAGEPGKGDIRMGARIARHAVRSVSTIFHSLSVGASRGWQTSVRRHMEQAQAMLDAYGVKSELKLEQGEWRQTLLKILSQEDFDLIVLGTTGSVNYGVADFALGLARNTGKCVLMVPPSEG